MRCNARWASAQSVVAAMTRATRRTPKENAEELSDSTVGASSSTSSSPLYLTSAVQMFAHQNRRDAAMQLSQLEESCSPSSFEEPLPLSPTFERYVEAARDASSLSRAQLHQLLIQATESGAAAVIEASCRHAPSSCPPHRDTAVHVTFPEQHAASDAAPSDIAAFSERSANFSREELAAALRAYDPTVSDALGQRVASRLNISNTLRLATQLVRYLREAAASGVQGRKGAVTSLAGGSPEATDITTSAAVELLRRAVDVCHVQHRQLSDQAGAARLPSASRTQWASTTAAREGAGITVRLHHAAASLSAHGQRRRRPLPRCHVHLPTDVQVSAVLPSGAVVVFTHATEPEEVAERLSGSPVHGKGDGDAKRSTRQKRAPASFCESLELHLNPVPVAVHLHCVLYRRRMSASAAVASLVEAAEGRIQADDVHVRLCMPEIDEHVVVQVCSVRVAIPGALRGQGRAEEALQHCLHVARTLAHVNVAAGEAKDARIGLQLLYCRPHSCAEPRGSSATSQLQYAILLRGFDRRGGPVDQLERTALTCSLAIPNFFSPHHFGPPHVPFFRTYHVAAALGKERYPEAAAMLLCLASEAPPHSTVLAPWLEHALRLLCRGEERDGPWLAWWLQHVPAEVQVSLLSAKAELVWNVLASARLTGLAMATNGSRDVFMAASPELGDFVSDPVESCERRGSADESTSTFVPPDARVVPLYNRADATRYTVHDIVLPLVRDAADADTACESITNVEERLGFTTPRLRRRRHESRSSSSNMPLTAGHHPRHHSLVFRPLFVRATGYPRAARPWSRSFEEPTATAAPESTSAVLSLAADRELASSAGQGRDYAAKSRGPRALVWPLSKRGRALTDRLPVGMLAVASAKGSSLLGGGTSSSHRYTSRCLAIHCTLPADASLSNYLCEFASVEDRRPSGQTC